MSNSQTDRNVSKVVRNKMKVDEKNNNQEPIQSISTPCPGPEVIKLFSLSIKYEILNAHKYKNIKKFCIF